jgi:DNA-binding CsgD family transcriptional regulator
MAHILDISVKTVETHRASVMHKLNLKTTADLVRYAVRNNIIEP